MGEREAQTVLQDRRGFSAAGRAAPTDAVGTGVPELWIGSSVLVGVRTPLMKDCFIPSRCAVSCASSLWPLSSPSAPSRRRH